MTTEERNRFERSLYRLMAKHGIHEICVRAAQKDIAGYDKTGNGLFVTKSKGVLATWGPGQLEEYTI